MKQEETVRDLRPEPEVILALMDARIAWVLDHPRTSDWLKHALRTADGLDPIALQNDVEMLKHLIVPRSQAQIDIVIASVFVE